MASHGRALLHVVQASYGDSFMLELDPTPDLTDATTTFILIDGGPGRNAIHDLVRYHTRDRVGKPKHNLFYMLNALSAESNPSVPDNRKLAAIDTIVLTHDDADHKQGIQDLFSSLLAAPAAPSGDAGDDSGDSGSDESDDDKSGGITDSDSGDELNSWRNSWRMGNELIRAKKSPILHIWYNSLQNLQTALNASRGATSTAVVTPGWFDKQLDQFTKMGLNPTLKVFNDELANNLPVDAPILPFAMIGAETPTAGAIKKGQFTFKFYGPPIKRLLCPQLIKKLQAKYGVDVSTADFTDEMAFIAADEVNSKVLQSSISLGNMSRKASLDRSLTNRSSIAFSAGDADTSILLLGDATAGDLFYEEFHETGADFGVMKIMHHGSYRNNFWKMDKARKDADPFKDIPAIQSSVNYFFAKVRAKKYIISASGLEEHPNPHVTTLLGIIYAAQENKASVDIYLTNPLPQSVFVKLAGVLKAKNWTLVDTRIHLLIKDISHYGTVALYDDDPDDPDDWVTFQESGADFWNDYRETMKENYPKIMESMRDLTYDLVIPPKRSKTKTSTADTAESKAESKAKSFANSHGHGGSGTFVSTGKLTNEGEGTDYQLAANFEESGLSIHYTPSDDIPYQHQQLTSSALAALNKETTRHSASGPNVSGLPSKATQDSVRDTTYSDLPSLLDDLVDQGVLTSSQVVDFNSDAKNDDGYYNMGAVMALFLGVDASEVFFADLPCDFDPNDTSSTSPSNWFLANFSADVLSSSGDEYTGWKGIASIAFSLSPPDNVDFNWSLPFTSKSLSSASYSLALDGSIDMSVQWPCYRGRITSGDFKGTLHGPSSTGKDYSIVGSYTSSKGRPACYTFQFSDGSYVTDGFTLKITDMLDIFGGIIFNFQDRLKDISIPQLPDLLDDLDDGAQLDNPGFTLEKAVSQVVLKQITGDFPIDEQSQWQPFGDSYKFSLSVTVLHVILENVMSSKGRRVVLQLRGSMSYYPKDNLPNAAELPYQFQVQLAPSGELAFEISLNPNGSIEIGNISDFLGMQAVLPLDIAFPGISDLSAKTMLTSVTIEWVGVSSVTPSHLTLSASIDDWIIQQDTMTLTKATAEIQVANPLSEGERQYSLHTTAAIDIGSAEFEIIFDVDNTSSQTSTLYFDISTNDKALPLRSIITHFFGNDFKFLPDAFFGLLDETTVDKLSLEACHDSTGWNILTFQLILRIEDTDVNIFESLTLGYPTLELSISHPFDSTQRAVLVSLKASVNFGDTATRMEVVLSSDEQHMIVALFDAQDSPLSLGLLMSYFIPDASTASLPSEFSFLQDLSISQASLTMTISNGSFSLSDFSVAVVSTSSFKLWDEISLDNLSVVLSYSKGSGTSVSMYTMLAFGDESDFLTFKLEYQPSSSSASSSNATLASDDNDNTTLSPQSDGSTWSASTQYEGSLSTFDILSRVSGIDISAEMNALSLSKLREVLDITATSFSAALLRSPSAISFSFEGQINWLIFTNLRFACSKSATWTYSFGLGVDPDLDVFSLIPGVGSAVSDVVSFKDISVAVFNHILDLSVFPAMNFPVTIQQDGFKVAFAGRLQLTHKLSTLGKCIGSNNASLDILGVVGDEFLELSVHIDDVTLFNGSLRLSGDVVVICDGDSDYLPEIGVKGTAVLNFGESVSKNPITTSLFLYVDTSTEGLGFDLKIDEWLAVFGYQGLDFKKVNISAEFPPEEFPVPSYIGLSAEVDLKVNNTSVSGDVAFRFVEVDLTRCYATGNLIGIDIANIILAFTGATIPPHLDAGFQTIAFKIVPKDMDDVNGDLIQQEFAMSGTMLFYGLTAAVDIDITLSRLVLNGRLSPLILLNNSNLFSILASPDEQPPPAAGSGAFIHISTDDTSNPLQISCQCTFLSVSNNLYIDLSSSGLVFAFTHSSANINSFSVKGIISTTSIAITSSLEFDFSFTLDVVIENVNLGSFTYDINLTATANVDFDWSEAETWRLYISGTYATKQFTKDLNLGPFSETLSDIENLCKEIVALIELSINADLATVLTSKTAFDAASLLSVGFGFGFIDIALVLIRLHFEPKDVLEAVKKIWVLTWDEIASIANQASLTTDEAISVMQAMGCATWDLVWAIGRAFGKAAEDACLKLLEKDAVASAYNIAELMTKVFFENAENISDALYSARYDVKAIARALLDLSFAQSDVFTAIMKSAALTWNQVAYTARDIGYAVQDVIDLLNEMSCSAENLAIAIGNAFGIDVEGKCVNILSDAGYGATTIASTVYDLFSDTAGNIASFLFNAKFSLYDSVYAVYVVFSLGVDDVKTILIALGATATEIVDIVKEIFSS